METMGDILRRNLLRLRGKKTQAQAAELAGLPVVSYQKAESGIVPREPNLQALAKAYEVSEVSLLMDSAKRYESAENRPLTLAVLAALFPALDDLQLNDIVTQARAFERANERKKANGSHKDTTQEG